MPVAWLRFAGKGLTFHVLTAGCRRGIVRWLPFGAGAALYYSVEYAVRPSTRGLASSITTAAAQEAEYDDPYTTASLASKAVAGAVAGTLVSIPMYAARWSGFRRPGSVLVMAFSCGVGALLMPAYEDVERRASGWGPGGQ
jgi:hypothetical protein